MWRCTKVLRLQQRLHPAGGPARAAQGVQQAVHGRQQSEAAVQRLGARGAGRVRPVGGAAAAGKSHTCGWCYLLHLKTMLCSHLSGGIPHVGCGCWELQMLLGSARCHPSNDAVVLQVVSVLTDMSLGAAVGDRRLVPVQPHGGRHQAACRCTARRVGR
jgi:hypothetical protein